MKKHFLSFLFVIIISFACLYVIIYQGLITLGKVKFEKTDNWQTVEKTNNKIYDKIKSIEVGIENRVNNYFPFFNSINNLYYKSIIGIDSLYLNDIYLKDNSVGEKTFLNKKDKYYFLVNNYNDDELENKTKDQVSFYNKLADNYSNTNFYIYLPPSYEMINNIKNFNSSLRYFKDNLSSKIKYKILDISKENFFDYYYKTDHHLNSYGALAVYKDILNLFNTTDNKNYSHKDVVDKYYGSAAKSLLIKDYYDTLSVIDINNTHDVNIDDKNFKNQKIEKQSFPFFDYYIQYFNGQYDEVIYNNKNNSTNNNLLVISDSLVWQFDYLLANYFDKTYVINMRYGKWKDNDLELSNYLKENNITNVLFILQGEDVLFDGNNYNLKERVK